MIVELWIPWKDVRVMLPFVSTDDSRYMLQGVYLEIEPEPRKTEWRARLVATEGKRLAVLETQVTSETPWKADWPTGFLIPATLIKRVKKPAKGAFPTKLTLELGLRPKLDPPAKSEDEEAAEPEPPPEAPPEVEPDKIEVLRLTVDAYHDTIRSSVAGVEGVYPNWREAVPETPYEPAGDAPVDGELVADFSIAIEELDGNAAVALYRTAHVRYQEDGSEFARALVVRSVSSRFFGVLMPMRPPWAEDDEMQLPLWLGDSPT